MSGSKPWPYDGHGVCNQGGTQQRQNIASWGTQAKKNQFQVLSTLKAGPLDPYIGISESDSILCISLDIVKQML